LVVEIDFDVEELVSIKPLHHIYRPPIADNETLWQCTAINTTVSYAVGGQAILNLSLLLELFRASLPSVCKNIKVTVWMNFDLISIQGYL